MSSPFRHGKSAEKEVTKTIQGQSLLLDCPSCHSLISADQVDLHTGEATCKNCGQQFDFEEELRQDPFRRPEMVIPDGVEVLRLRSMLDIVVDWYKGAPKKQLGATVFSSFFWNIILVPLVILLAVNGHFIMVLFLIGHVITGLSLIAYLIALFFNKTHIEVTKDGIKIRHEPIPSPIQGDRFIPKHEIDQLFVARYRQKFSKKDKKGVEAYALYAITKQQKVVELIKGMNKETQLFLEQEIESYLEIKDRPVRGEVER